MKNRLEIMKNLTKKGSYIAEFTGITGMGERVFGEIAEHLTGGKADVIREACNIWGIFADETTIIFE